LINRTQTFLIFFLILTFAAAGVTYYCEKTHSPSANEIIIRQAFVKATGLPDLSVFLDDISARHRSLTDISSVYTGGQFAPDVRFSDMVYRSGQPK